MKYLNAMKTNKLLAAAFVVMAATSCAKENINISEPSGNRLSINAACANTKTILQNGQEVYWTPDDIIRVFDNEGKDYEFTNSLESPAASAEFTCENWPVGAIPKYATAFNPGYKAACTTAGVFTVRVGCEQLVSHASSFACKANASVGIVEGESGAYTISEMKNVAGLIKITFTENNKIKSLSVQAIGGEPLTGWINVDYAKLVGGDNDYWTSTPNKELLPKLTLKPSGDQKASDGSFVSGEYYLPVIPQTYAKGLRFVMTDTEGNVAIRTVGKASGFTVERNSIKSFSAAVDQGVSFTATQSPDSLVFRLGGDAWNFTTEPVAADKQDASNGETYQYELYDFASGFTSLYPFTFCKGKTGGYSYLDSEQAVEFAKGDGTGGWIKFPAIEGYIIKSITLAHRNSGNRNFSLIENALTTENGGKELIAGTGIAAGQTFEKTFYANDEVKPTENTPTYLKILSNSSFYRNITIVYAKELPKKPTPPLEPEIVVGYTDASKVTVGSADADGNRAISIAGSDYKFTAMSGFIAKKAGTTAIPYISDEDHSGYIRFPAIEHYKLTAVHAEYTTAANSNKKASITSDTSGTIVAGGEAVAANKDKPSNFTLSETEANTSYYLRLHYKAIRVSVLQATYTLVEE